MKSFSISRLQTSTIGCFLLAGMAFISVPCALGEVSDSSSPESLSRAFRLLDRGEFADAEKEFDVAAKDSSLAAWALLGRALSYRGLGENEAVLRTLEKIPEKSPASFDARVLRLRTPGGSQKEKISDLKREAKQLGREDLLTVLLSMEVDAELSNKKFTEAFDLYRELRPRLRRHSALPLGLSREETAKPTEIFKKRFSGKPLAEFLLYEAEQLFADRKIDSALTTLRELQPLVTEDGKTIILRAKVLRAAGRTEEGNALLEKRSEKAKGPEAAAFLLELSRVLWNQNKHAASRRFALRFLKEFPNAKESEEVRHILAHTWIGEGDWEKGFRELQKLAELKSGSDYNALAQRDLAWLNFRRGLLENSSRWFSTYRETVTRRFEIAKTEVHARERAKKLRDAKFEEEHAKFWSAELCKLQNREKKDSSCPFNADDIFTDLAANSPATYYGLLSVKRLGKAFPPPSFINLKAEIPDDGSARDASQCDLQCSGELEQTLKALRAARLKLLVTYELRWFLKNSAASYLSAALPSSETSPDSNPDAVRRSLCLLAFFNRFGEHSAALPIAELLLKSNAHTVTAEDRALAARAAFPFPFQKAYREESNRQSMPAALALAISRTESHFDPSARSTSDARGLMQLLTKTAAAEGLSDGERLFDPLDNIAVGVKHLAGLLRHFKNEDLAAGAYNAGRTAVIRWMARTTPGVSGKGTDLENLGMDAWIETVPYSETRNYIKKVRLARSWYGSLYKELDSRTD